MVRKLLKILCSRVVSVHCHAHSRRQRSFFSIQRLSSGKLATPPVVGLKCSSEQFGRKLALEQRSMAGRKEPATISTLILYVHTSSTTGWRAINNLSLARSLASASNTFYCGWCLVLYLPTACATCSAGLQQSHLLCTTALVLDRCLAAGFLWNRTAELTEQNYNVIGCMRHYTLVPPGSVRCSC